MSRPAFKSAMPMEPLCTTAATRPRDTPSGMVVPQAAARLAKLTKPRQFGPHTARSCVRAMEVSSAWARTPSAPASLRRRLGHRDEHEIDGLADGVEARKGSPAEELGPARRDEVHGAGIAEALQREPRVEPGADLLGGADDGDGRRAQQPGHAHRSTSLGSRASLMRRSGSPPRSLRAARSKKISRRPDDGDTKRLRGNASSSSEEG